MNKTPIENTSLKIYGNMLFDVTDQPVSFDDLPIEFLDAKTLWEQDSQKNFPQIANLLNQYLKAIFLPCNINNWEELFIDKDESGMPEYLAKEIRLKKINYTKDQCIPHCGVEAIFEVLVTPKSLQQESLIIWQEDNDYFFNALMFGWEIPRNENTEDLDFMADGHAGCECIVNFEGSL